MSSIGTLNLKSKHRLKPVPLSLWGGTPVPRPTPSSASRILFTHKQPGEGARRGSGEPPHENCADLGKLSDIGLKPVPSGADKFLIPGTGFSLCSKFPNFRQS